MSADFATRRIFRRDPYMTQSAELMRRGKMPKKSELEKDVDIMEIGVPGEIKI